jgi:hypothetical protein
MEKGIEFENKLVQFINKEKIKIKFVSQYITDKSINKTIEYMMKGIPVIHSAPVRNINNKTHGIIDLLVRSDYIEKIVDECPIKEEEKFMYSSKLDKPYYYVVIDIKFSTLPLKSDGKHILNTSNYPAYKSQLYIYTEAVGLIQGYTSRYAFIMGRRWNYTKTDIKYSDYTCTNKLGVIDYEKVDKIFVQKTKNALKWLNNVKENGYKWSVYPPSRKELYPNMCVDSGIWQKEKEKISENIGEISSIWYCGVKNREIALQNGIKSWKDPNCVSSNMGINGTRATIIDSILNINRQNIDKIRPQSCDQILNNLFDWKNQVGENPLEYNEMFVDFETFSDILAPFTDLPFQKITEMIFLIGIYWKNENTWEYKKFICRDASYDEEYRIMNEFITFLKKHNNPKLWFWCAENKFWKSAENRQFDFAIKHRDEGKKEGKETCDYSDYSDYILNHWSNINLCDMCDIFKKEPIVIKNCFSFKLKEIAKALYNHNLIKTKLDSNCNNGMTACIKAYNIYKTDPNPLNNYIMKDIIKYNEFDCKVLYDILNYLRSM